MDLQARKAIIIEQSKQGNYDIPEVHQKLVMERFKNARKNPESLVDWEEAKQILNIKFRNLKYGKPCN